MTEETKVGNGNPFAELPANERVIVVGVILFALGAMIAVSFLDKETILGLLDNLQSVLHLLARG